MKVLKLISKEIFKFYNLYAVLVGIVSFAFKFFDKNTVIAYSVFIFLINELLIYFNFKSLKNRFEKLRLTFIILAVYSIFFPVKFFGVIFLSILTIETLAVSVSSVIKQYKRIFSYNINISIIYFFFILMFLLGSVYFYFFSGFITKQEVLFLFLGAALLSIVQNIKLYNFSNYFSLAFLGIPGLILVNLIDFHIRISSINIMFGSIITAVAWVVLILLDIIKLERSFKYFLLLFVLYIGLGYPLFVFNYVLLIFYSIIFKVRHKYEDRFIFLKDVDFIFLLSALVAVVFVFIPHYTFIKSSLVVGLTSFFIFKNYKFFSSTLKHFFKNKKIKLLRKHNINIIIFNLLLSVILLWLAYLLGLIRYKNLVAAFIIVNSCWGFYKFIEIKSSYLLYNKVSEFVLTFLPFQLFLLWSIK